MTFRRRFLASAQLARLFAIDVEFEAGIVEVLRNQMSLTPRRAAEFLRDFLAIW